MEPGAGTWSHSGDYGCPAWTFDQEQEQDPMSALFFLPESQSPPPSLLWQSLPPPPADGFAGTENFGDGGQIISPLLGMPCNPPAAVAEETNYAAAPPAPLVVATHGTGAGLLVS